LPQERPGVVAFVFQGLGVKILHDSCNKSNERAEHGETRGDELSVFAEKRFNESPIHETKEMHK